MKRTATGLLMIALLLTPFAARSNEKRAKNTAQWTQKMRELSKLFSELLPLVVSEEKFNSPKNAKVIERDAKKLSTLAHGLNRKMPMNAPSGIASPDADPTLPMISGLFQDETRRAYEALKKGRRPYARSILKTIPGFCIGCHSRGQVGPDLSSLSRLDLKGLTRFDRAEYLAATRRFDSALDEYEKIIADPASAQGRQLEWERALRNALTLSIRVKRDPARALTIVERALASPSCPQFIKQDAEQWKQSLKEWQEEGPRSAQTEEGLYAESKRLVSAAYALQKYPADRAADVLYLRSSAAIHDLLRAAPQGKTAPEALFLLGVTYEALRDLDLWSLHELYYEACIRREPHSEIAHACFTRYEQSTYAGYSGTGGVSLPSDIRSKLTELKRLAEPKVVPPR